MGQIQIGLNRLGDFPSGQGGFTNVDGGGDRSGVPSVKNFYRAIISTKNLSTIGGWERSIWHWNLQLKIKLFLWLAS
jgi:hypothetical protein